MELEARMVVLYALLYLLVGLCLFVVAVRSLGLFAEAWSKWLTDEWRLVEGDIEAGTFFGLAIAWLLWPLVIAAIAIVGLLYGMGRLIFVLVDRTIKKTPWWVFDRMKRMG